MKESSGKLQCHCGATCWAYLDIDPCSGELHAAEVWPGQYFHWCDRHGPPTDAGRHKLPFDTDADIQTQRY